MDFEVDVPNCFCGRNVRCFTSWTDSNPGRRFLGCPNFRVWFFFCFFRFGKSQKLKISLNLFIDFVRDR